MGGAKRRWTGVLLGAVVAAISAVVLAGLLSLLQPKLLFAGFPLGAALGGAVAGYQARRWPMLQGAVVGLVAGLVELAFLFMYGPSLLPDWSVAGLVAVTAFTGLLGARMAYMLRAAVTHNQPSATPRDLGHEARDTPSL